MRFDFFIRFARLSTSDSSRLRISFTSRKEPKKKMECRGLGLFALILYDDAGASIGGYESAGYST